MIIAPMHEANDCHDPATGEFCDGNGVPAAKPYVSRPKPDRKGKSARMRQQRLDRGGIVAQKQRDLDYRMARGRETQRLIRMARRQGTE